MKDLTELKNESRQLRKSLESLPVRSPEWENKVSELDAKNQEIQAHPEYPKSK